MQTTAAAAAESAALLAVNMAEAAAWQRYPWRMLWPTRRWPSPASFVFCLKNKHIRFGRNFSHTGPGERIALANARWRQLEPKKIMSHSGKRALKMHQPRSITPTQKAAKLEILQLKGDGSSVGQTGRGFQDAVLAQLYPAADRKCSFVSLISIVISIFNLIFGC